MHISLKKQVFFCSSLVVFFVKTSKIQSWFEVWTFLMSLWGETFISCFSCHPIFPIVLVYLLELLNVCQQTWGLEWALTNFFFFFLTFAYVGRQHADLSCYQRALKVFSVWIWRVETSMSLKGWFIVIVPVHRNLYRSICRIFEISPEFSANYEIFL